MFDQIWKQLFLTLICKRKHRKKIGNVHKKTGFYRKNVIYDYSFKVSGQIKPCHFLEMLTALQVLNLSILQVIGKFYINGGNINVGIYFTQENH